MDQGGDLCVWLFLTTELKWERCNVHLCRGMHNYKLRNEGFVFLSLVVEISKIVKFARQIDESIITILLHTAPTPLSLNDHSCPKIEIVQFVRGRLISKFDYRDQFESNINIDIIISRD